MNTLLMFFLLVFVFGGICLARFVPRSMAPDTFVIKLLTLFSVFVIFFGLIGFCDVFKHGKVSASFHLVYAAFYSGLMTIMSLVLIFRPEWMKASGPA